MFAFGDDSDSEEDELLREISNSADDRCTVDSSASSSAISSAMSTASTATPTHCSDCNVELIRDEAAWICQQCGKVSSVQYDEVLLFQNRDLYCNSSRHSSVIAFSGKGSREFTRTLVDVGCSYPLYRKNVSKQELEKLLDFPLVGIPKSILDDVWDYYEEIAEAGYNYRTENKRGIWAVLIFYTCINNDIPRTESEIMKMMNIASATFNKSEKKVIELAAEKIIHLNTDIDRCENYIHRYMMLLGIDIRFKQFVYDLILFSRKYHLTLQNESKLLSKCIGGIYMLCMRVPKYRHIDNKQISQKCNISTTTFCKFYKTLCRQFVHIKPVFIRHSIPMPKDWKSQSSR